MACLESLQIVKMNTELSHPCPTIQNKESGRSTGYGGGTPQAKVSAKKCSMPLNSACQKLQKVDLSLEAYVQVLLSMEQGQQLLHRKSCSLQTLRKVLSVNSFASSKATKECITQNLHQLPLFKPFFSSLSGGYKDLQVDAIAMMHTEVAEDLHALEWLEYGQFNVELEAECLLGISAEQKASCLSSKCQKRESCWPKSCVADGNLASGMNQLYNLCNLNKSHTADRMEPQISTSQLTTESATAEEPPSLPERINWCRQLESSCGESHVKCLEIQSTFGSPSSVSNSYVAYGKQHTKGCDLVSSIELDPCQFIASANADTLSRSYATKIDTGRDLQEAEVCPSADGNEGRDTRATEVCGISDKRLTVLKVKRNIVQDVLSPTLVSELPEFNCHPVEKPFSTQTSIIRQDISPIYDLQHTVGETENLGGNLPSVLQSPKGGGVLSMSCSTTLLDEGASKFSQSGCSQNVNRNESASLVVNGLQSSSKLDKATHKLAECPCSETSQVDSTEKENCKELVSCQSANQQDFSSDCKKTEAEGSFKANCIPMFEMATGVNPAKTASGMTPGHAASGMTLVSELPEFTCHPVEKPFSTQINIYRQEISPIYNLQHTAGETENLGGNLPSALRSPNGGSVLSMSCSTTLLDEGASKFSQSGYSQNVNSNESGSLVVNNLQSSSKLDMATHELAECPCSAISQVDSTEKENCKESVSCQSANQQDFSSDCKRTEADSSFKANCTPTFEMAAGVNPAKTASGMTSGHTADVGRVLSPPSLANEASNVAPAPSDGIEPSKSAAFLEVLSGGGLSSGLSSGGPSACYEDSLDLLERWRKRRQQAPDKTDRMIKSSNVQHLAGMASKRQRTVDMPSNWVHNEEEARTLLVKSSTGSFKAVC